MKYLAQLSVAMLFFLAGTPAQTAPHRLALPNNIEWKYNAKQGDKTVEFLLPRDLKAIQAMDKTIRAPLLADIQRVERNQRLARRIGESFFNSTDSARFGRLTPDYARRLSEVAVSIAYADAQAENPLDRNMPVLKALPQYTRINVIMPTASEKAARKALVAESLIERSVLRPVSGWDKKKENVTEYSRATRWIRDTFLVGSANDNAMVYQPLAYAFISDLTHSDLNFLETSWHKKSSVVKIPAFIRGGNVAVADNSTGRRVAFMGVDEINQNEAHYRHATGITPPRDLVPEIVKKLAGVDRVEILQNSTLLFHIDMAVSFIAPGVAALLSPIDEAQLGTDEAIVLTVMRKSLAANGFRIIDIPTTVSRIRAYQSPVNILPFTDKITGTRRAIVPQFPDISVKLGGRTQSLNEAIQNAYKKSGVEIIFAEDRFADRRGNLHCTIIGLN